MKRTKKSKIEKCPWALEKPFILTKSDKRYNHHLKQLNKWGFSDSETWNLDSVFSRFILPRLKRFAELNNGHPSDLSPKQWQKMLSDMIFAFEWSLSQQFFPDDTLSKKELDKGWERYDVGMQFFAKRYRELWW